MRTVCLLVVGLLALSACGDDMYPTGGTSNMTDAQLDHMYPERVQAREFNRALAEGRLYYDFSAATITPGEAMILMQMQQPAPVVNWSCDRWGSSTYCSGF